MTEQGRGAPWRAYAIRFARREASLRQEHFYRGDPHGADPMPIDYFIWLLDDGEQQIVVDAGFTEEVAARRGNRRILARPAEVLRALGVAPDRVAHVVLTHLHYDHTGHLREFPNAHVHLQQSELEFWTGKYAGRGENPNLVEADDLAYVRSIVEAGRATLHDGDAEIAPGVRLHHVGGHTAGLQVVAAHTGAGQLVLASDATHFYANIGEDRPYSIVDHLPSMYDAFDWINAEAGSASLVVPGHDPEVMARYDAVPGLDGVAVRLA